MSAPVFCGARTGSCDAHGQITRGLWDPLRIGCTVNLVGPMRDHAVPERDYVKTVGDAVGPMWDHQKLVAVVVWLPDRAELGTRNMQLGIVGLANLELRNSDHGTRMVEPGPGGTRTRRNLDTAERGRRNPDGGIRTAEPGQQNPDMAEPEKGGTRTGRRNPGSAESGLYLLNKSYLRVQAEASFAESPMTSYPQPLAAASSDLCVWRASAACSCQWLSRSRQVCSSDQTALQAGAM